MKEKIPGLIDYPKAKKLHQNWLETQGKILADALGNQQSYEVNFNATELLEYLKYVIESSKKQGLENPGIRILFGAYNEGENPLPNRIKTNTTVVLIPTVESSSMSNCNKDIDPLNRGHSGWPPIGL